MYCCIRSFNIWICCSLTFLHLFIAAVLTLCSNISVEKVWLLFYFWKESFAFQCFRKLVYYLFMQFNTFSEESYMVSSSHVPARCWCTFVIVAIMNFCFWRDMFVAWIIDVIWIFLLAGSAIDWTCNENQTSKSLFNLC